MLSKKYRLTRKQINLIYKKGIGKKYGNFGVKYLKNRVLVPRFAVVVPAAVAKKAVDRNRLRRVIYSEVEKYLKNDTIAGSDYIIRVYRAMEDEKILRQEICKIFENV